MALSNMLDEPRREIIETVVGVAIFALVLAPIVWLDYTFAVSLSTLDGGPPIAVGMLLGAAALMLAVFMVVALCIFVHFIGEETCDWLQDKGVRLRPRRHWRR